MPQLPVIAVWGSRELESCLRVHGFRVLSIRSLKQLGPEPGTELPRLIVIEHLCKDATKQKSLTAVKEIRKSWPLIDIVLWAPQAAATFVRQAFQAGAKDVVVSRKDAQIVDAVQQILDAQQLLPMVEELAHQRVQGSRFESMLSRSSAMWDLFALCARIAASNATVLIVGETGTGKELFARALHRRSGLSGRFVAANCASIRPELIESELFGHEKGAFTGAERKKAGLVQHAHQGTLFLDEIGDMPEQAQLSLLRLLQEQSIRPVGAEEEVDVDVRIIAATHLLLDEAVEARRFREDLFYRLDVIRITIPSLRERPEDIVFLFGHFVKKLAKHYGTNLPQWSDQFLEAMAAFDWPGNVRQLENFAERVVLSGPRGRLSRRSFSRLIQTDAMKTQTVRSSRKWRPGREDVEIDLNKTLSGNLLPMTEQMEQAYLTAVLRENNGAIENSAKQAGMNRRTLLRKLKTHGIDKSEFK